MQTGIYDMTVIGCHTSYASSYTEFRLTVEGDDMPKRTEAQTPWARVRQPTAPKTRKRSNVAWSCMAGSIL